MNEAINESKTLAEAIGYILYSIFLMPIGTIVKHKYLRIVVNKLVREVGSLVSQARLDQTINDTETRAEAIGCIPNFYLDWHYTISPWILARTRIARLSAQRKVRH
jgi:hypothetical protein